MVMNTNTLLEVKNLCVDYNAANGTVHAVNDVSFTLGRGEILGLAGESGCGKSTLAYAIARLLRPPAVIAGGQVLYYPRTSADQQGRSFASSIRSSKLSGKGRGRTDALQDASMDVVDVLDLSPAELRAFRWQELSIVFQSAMNALNPVMNIETQIMDVLKAHRPDMRSEQRKQRAIELLKIVGIAPDRLRSYPHELSGGMRQRAVIAIALALRPELIIMDEPTTALDVVVQREILELISGLCKEFNTALIFITHDLSLLLELADKIAIMYAGNMIEKATSRDIYLHPRHPYSYGLLNSFPTLHGPRHRMAGIPGSPPDLRTVATGCTFAPRCPLAFSTCSTVVPELLPLDESGKIVSTTAEQSVQRAACHLYDPRFHAEPPSTADLAAKYEALAEGSNVQ